LNFAFISFVLFVLVQAFFALMANSQSMLADCEAMSVDALTYLFNLCAERIKNRPFTEKELDLSSSTREYYRELQRLSLELIPPAISVATLIAVTVVTLREAFGTLFGKTAEEEEAENVSAMIMLLFSSANLLLDVVNMTCFARADSTFSLDLVRRGTVSISMGVQEVYRRSSFTIRNDSAGLQQAVETSPHEQTGLLAYSAESFQNSYQQDENQNDDDSVLQSPSNSAARFARFSSSRLTPSAPHELVNLNMCSAWTHVCADTMRSAAVLIAAALAFLVPGLVPTVADSLAAVVVSFIILVSLFPLLQGLFLTAIEIASLLQDGPPTDERPDDAGEG